MTKDAPLHDQLLRDALLTIRRLRQQVQREPIAVVGIGCRFPGDINSPEAFWEALAGGADLIGPVPADRWDADAYYDADVNAPGRICTRAGGFLKHKDLFDPQFFRIAPREAMYMDPQQRVLLEVAWEALEHAHIPAEKLHGSNTGVFVGISAFDYANLVAEHLPETEVDPTVGTGSGHSPASGRLSYFFGFRGPSLSVDTACSSSLVAVQTACDSLRRGECQVALAGGVNMILSPFNHVVFSRAHMLAPDGRCKTFDEAADGYVRSEGAGVLVLRRLADAIADRHTILAVIKGGAVNHGGASGGLTVPNGAAQQDLIRAALRNASVAESAIDYVEAHGTGTALGDPIELIALGEVYAAGRDPQRPLLVGSAKTNLGHLESAAGLAGLAKVILQLQHEAIAPHLHLTHPSSRIPWARLPVAVPTTLTPWPRWDRRPRVAGVSSYGFSGTNAHLIVEEPPPAPPPDQTAPARPVHVLALSAKTESALRALVDRYIERLASADCAAADFAYSANAGRSHFRCRVTAVGTSIADFREQLVAWAAGGRAPHAPARAIDQTRPRKIAFLFAGQGAEIADAGRELYRTSPHFGDVIDRCDAVARSVEGWSIVDALYAKPRPHDLRQTAFTQPVLFALEFALASLWRSWGIEPAFVLGHSVGEFAAAAFAGVFTLEDGLRLVLARGALMQSLTADGAMVAVHAPLETIEAVIAPFRRDTSVAAINAPKNVVVSGSVDSVRAVVSELDRAGVRTQGLDVTRAFHSPLMEPMLGSFAAVATSVSYTVPQLGVVSAVTGLPVTTEFASADYWVRHVTEPVRFMAALRAVQDAGCTTFLEIGPRATLLSLARASSADREHQFIATLDPARGEWRQTIESLATLYAGGHSVDWAQFDAGHVRSWVPLPTYPFQRERYWFSADAVPRKNSAPRVQGPRHELLGARKEATADAGGAGALLFESRLTEDSPAFLRHHRVFHRAVLPAAVYAELALAAGCAACRNRPILKQIAIQKPLVLQPGCVTLLRTSVVPNGSEWTFEVSSRVEVDGEVLDGLQRHAHGILQTAPLSGSATRRQDARIDSMRAVDRDIHYDGLRARGLNYGPAFRGIQELWTGEAGVVARVAIPPGVTDDDHEYVVHPVILDSAFQAVAAAVRNDDATTYLPTGMESLRAFATVRREHWVEAQLRPGTRDGARRLVADVRLFDGEGALALEVVGLQLTRVEGRMLRHAIEGDASDLMYAVTWKRQTVDPHRRLLPESRRALIIGDTSSVGTGLFALLQARGIPATLLRPDDDAMSTDVWRLLSEPNQDIVYCPSLDAPAAPVDTAAALERTGNLGCNALLQVVQAAPRSSRLWLLTRGAVAVDRRSPVALASAAQAGMLTAVRAEDRLARCGHLDLDPDAGRDGAAIELRQIADEIASADGEDEIALRRGLRFVPRLQPRAGGSGSTQPTRIALTAVGVIEHLTVTPLDRSAPRPGEIEVEVRAAGLNFKDVLHVLGILPPSGDPADIELGFECAGVVAAVGADVAGRQIGDQVIVYGTRCLRSHVVVSAGAVIAMPPSLTFAEAAAIPTAFLTAYHALYTLARIQPGETVLVHAGAGGVGQAAIQLCRRVGATVFATASEPKADFLRAAGVALVMNSRDLRFRDQILEHTGGRGVDVVLNSLNGDAIPANLDVLAPGGRFVEIGKVGAWTSEAVAAVRPDVDYVMFDLSEAGGQVAARFTPVLTKVARWLQDRAIQPLTTDVFGIEDVARAFRHLAHGKNIGKVVLAFPAPAADDAPPFARADRTYLITGGLGALGLKVAEDLVDHGARQLVLAGRRNGSPEAAASVEALRTRGARIEIMLCDVANRELFARALRTTLAGLPPLAGIVHAAGVLDDALVKDQTAERFARVLAPKVAGAWNLHTATIDQPLDWFVAFGSIAGVLGSPGQSNYAAANAWLDAFMHHRRILGLPGVSIDWGRWASVGMAAGLDEARRRQLRAKGLHPIPVGRGLSALRSGLRGPAQLIAAAVDWPTFAGQARQVPRLIEDLVTGSGGVPAAPPIASTTAAGVRDLPPAERHEAVLSHLRRLLATTLGFAPDKAMEAADSFVDLGMDSLSAVEFANHIEATLGVVLYESDLFEHRTLQQLVDHVLAAMIADQSEPTPVAV